MALTIDDLLWFLNDVRGQRYYCAYCGHDAFTLIAGEEISGASAAASPPPRANGVDPRDFYGVSCTKCGNTVFFADDVVREALTKRPRGAAERS